MEINLLSLKPMLEERLIQCQFKNISTILSDIYKKYEEEKISPDRHKVYEMVHMSFGKISLYLSDLMKQVENEIVELLAKKKQITNFLEDFESGALNSDNEFKSQIETMCNLAKIPEPIPTPASLLYVINKVEDIIKKECKEFQEKILQNQSKYCVASALTLENATKTEASISALNNQQVNYIDEPLTMLCESGRGISVNPKKENEFLLITTEGVIELMNSTGEIVKKMPQQFPHSRYHQVLYSPNGSSYISSNAINQTIRYCTSFHEVKYEFTKCHDKMLTNVLWLGENLFMGLFIDGCVQVYCCEKNQKIKSFYPFSSKNQYLTTAIYLGGEQIVGGDNKGQITCIQFIRGEINWVINKAHSQTINSIIFDPNQNYIISSSGDNSICGINLNNNEVVWKKDFKENYLTLCLNPKSGLLFAHSATNSLVLLNTENGSVILNKKIEGAENLKLTTMGHSSESSKLYIGTNLSSVIVIDYLQKECQEEIKEKSSDSSQRCNIF